MTEKKQKMTEEWQNDRITEKWQNVVVVDNILIAHIRIFMVEESIGSVASWI